MISKFSRANPECPQCPHCGYDFSGTAASWTTAVPLRVICSECGSEVASAYILNKHLRAAPGFIESVEIRGRSLPRRWCRALVASWRTGLWTLLPWRFFNRVGAEVPVNFSRLAVWLLCMVITIKLFGILATTTRYFGYQTFAFVYHGHRAFVADLLNEVLSPFAVADPWKFDFDPSKARNTGTPVPYQMNQWRWLFTLPPNMRQSAPFLAAMLLFPLTLFAISPQLRRDQSNRRVLARCAMYSTSFLLLASIVTLMLYELSVFLMSHIPDAIFYMSAHSRTQFPSIETQILGFIWLSAWWYHASKHHLRLSSARETWSISVAVALLGGLLCYAAWKPYLPFFDSSPY